MATEVTETQPEKKRSQRRVVWGKAEGQTSEVGHRTIKPEDSPLPTEKTCTHWGGARKNIGLENSPRFIHGSRDKHEGQDHMTASKTRGRKIAVPALRHSTKIFELTTTSHGDVPARNGLAPKFNGQSDTSWLKFVTHVSWRDGEPAGMESQREATCHSRIMDP